MNHIKSYILAFIMLAAFLTASAIPNDAILMSDIKVLTLYKDRMTTGRRTKPMKQLTRFGGNAKGYEPETVQCTNQGTNDQGIVQWKCESNMPANFHFGKISVSCEGYSRPGDKLVLKGSCGLKYELNQSAAPKRERRERKPHKRTFTTTTTTRTTPNVPIEEESGFFSTFFTVVFIIGVIVFIIVIIKCCSGSEADNLTRQGQPIYTTTTTSSNPFASATAPPYVPSFTSYTHNTYVASQPSYTAPSYTTTTTTTTVIDEDSDDEPQASAPSSSKAAYASTEYRDEKEDKKKNKYETKTAYGESEDSR